MIYKFNHFENTGLVKHGFSTRIGGVSEGAYASMNLGLSRGDKRENVLKNYEIFCGKLGINVNNLIFSAQTHTTNVIAVTKEDRGNGIISKNKYKDVDGLVTCEKETALVTFYADCVPLYFLDPVKKVIGLSHGGWRGTLNKIAKKTVEFMVESYGVNVAHILVGIGPSIGSCCFETDEPVYSLFEKAGYKQYISKTGDKKKNIDLWSINKEILIESGVDTNNIEIMGLCTKCKENEFFSHRRMGNERGSLIAIMELI